MEKTAVGKETVHDAGMGKVKRERCYVIPASDGKGTIQIRATKRPAGKTLKALQNLFEAAAKLMGAK